jgi:hypothetical protein
MVQVHYKARERSSSGNQKKKTKKQKTTAKVFNQRENKRNALSFKCLGFYLIYLYSMIAWVIAFFDEVEPGFLLGIGSSPWKPTLWSDALIIDTILAVYITTFTIRVNLFFLF